MSKSAQKGMAQDRVLSTLGLTGPTLQNWVSRGLAKPSVHQSKGGTRHGRPSRNIYSRTDWLELKAAAVLRQAGVGMKTVRAVVSHIRRHKHRLEPEAVHVIGRVVWSASLKATTTVPVDYSAKSRPYVPHTVFLNWDQIERVAEDEFRVRWPLPDKQPRQVRTGG